MSTAKTMDTGCTATITEQVHEKLKDDHRHMDRIIITLLGADPFLIESGELEAADAEGKWPIPSGYEDKIVARAVAACGDMCPLSAVQSNILGAAMIRLSERLEAEGHPLGELAGWIMAAYSHAMLVMEEHMAQARKELDAKAENDELENLLAKILGPSPETRH